MLIGVVINDYHHLRGEGGGIGGGVFIKELMLAMTAMVPQFALS